MILSASELSILVEREDKLAAGEKVDDIPSEVFSILEEDMVESAMDMERQLKSHLTSCGTASPGYLVRDIGEWRLFVPWHLSEPLPDDDVIKLYINIGSELAASQRDGLNISGSAAFGGAEIEIGDLDFSQYLAMLGSSLSEELTRLRAPSAERLLLKASYGMDGATRSSFPWDDWVPFIEEISSCSQFEDSKRIMLEFLTKTDHLGLLPSSIVIMMSDFADRSLGSSRFSFVFQELVGVPVPLSQPTWSMIDPSQLGAYLLFLLGQVDKYRHTNPIKAVKRGLSVAYLLGLSDAIDAAIALLESDGAKADVRRKRYSDISDMLDLLDGHSVLGWSDARKLHAIQRDAAMENMPSPHIFNGFFSTLTESFAREGLTGSRWKK